MAKWVYIAIQDDTSAADTNKSWNNVLTTTASLSGLVDEDGSATAYDFDVTSAPQAEFAVTPISACTGDAVWVDEQVIREEHHYCFDATSAATYRLSGLDNAKTYRIEIYGAWIGSGDATSRTLQVSYDGFTTVHGTLETFANSTEVIALQNVSPSGGVIDIDWRRESGTSDITAVSALRFIESSLSGSASIAFSGGGEMTATASPVTGGLKGSATITLFNSGAWLDSTITSSNLAGSTTLAFTSSGDIDGIFLASGATSIAFSAGGNLVAAPKMKGTATIALSATGNARTYARLSGTATITFGTPGKVYGYLDGSTTFGFTATGELSSINTPIYTTNVRWLDTYNVNTRFQDDADLQVQFQPDASTTVRF